MAIAQETGRGLFGGLSSGVQPGGLCGPGPALQTRCLDLGLMPRQSMIAHCLLWDCSVCRGTAALRESGDKWGAFLLVKASRHKKVKGLHLPVNLET